MKSSQPIFLKGDNTVVNIDGYETTIGELKEHVIDSVMYRKHLKELRGDD
jgi:hypothetical protein